MGDASSCPDILGVCPTVGECLGGSNPGAVCTPGDDGTCPDDPGSCASSPVGIEGNVVVDPQYTDPGNGDYSLVAGSPTIDAGVNVIREFVTGTDDCDGDPIELLVFGISVSLRDLAEMPRVIDGESPMPDGVATVDLGALEFAPGPPEDVEGDGVDQDGDGSGVEGDNRCADGVTTDCDDSCPTTFDAAQTDTERFCVDAGGSLAGPGRCDCSPRKQK